MFQHAVRKYLKNPHAYFVLDRVPSAMLALPPAMGIVPFFPCTPIDSRWLCARLTPQASS